MPPFSRRHWKIGDLRLPEHTTPEPRTHIRVPAGVRADPSAARAAWPRAVEANGISMVNQPTTYDGSFCALEDGQRVVAVVGTCAHAL